MHNLLTAIFIVIGILFMFVASLGVLRMPDLFLRMSASTKAATLGSGAILLGVAVHLEDAGVTSRVIATIVFLLLTAPVAAHMLGRAGYFTGVKLYEGTLIDELHGRYNLSTHLLDSCEPAAVPQPPAAEPTGERVEPVPNQGLR